MKDKLMFLYFIDGGLDGLCGRAERKIEKIAVCRYADAEETFDKLSRLCDLKSCLINLRVLRRKLRSELSRDEDRIMVLFAKHSLANVRRLTGISSERLKTMRRRAISKCRGIVSKTPRAAVELDRAVRFFPGTFRRYKAALNGVRARAEEKSQQNKTG